MIKKLESFLLKPSVSMHQVMALIDKNGKGIALIVDEKRRLLGTVTDGDIRRAILARMDLEKPVSELLARKVNSPYPKPLAAPVGTDRLTLLQMMKEHGVRHIPLLDTNGCVADLVTLDDLLPDQVVSMQAVIMAGGLGKRLLPLTEDTPKPMLPVGGKPLMERIIEQLRGSGINRINISTYYKAEKIINYFGDGSRFGVKLNYINENQPLGTAGALGLIEGVEGPLLVINGDVISQVNYRAMVAYHQEHKADLTVAVSKYDLKVPYGVVESDGVFIREILEKPSFSFFVNAGIYLLEPSVYDYIPKNEHFDMTNLIECLIKARRAVVSFPIVEYWLDIGQHVDYYKAQEDAEKGRF
ncbi:nucleotidyltransferase family protein [Acetomicrobium sp.]|uniref:nucleotidyltransferase family protein n=1 Tax=Acetomicrobium sp. TaxID=1872099 RepID=UPI002B25E845|nr:nucleotidyltransferase family protein [Acetomicrobium sp.]